MNKEIKQILEDLYKIDQSLRKHESKLIKLIEKLLAAKPDTKLDDKFIQELRTKIMKEADQLKSIEKPEEQPVSLINIFMNMPKYAYVGAGAVLTLVLVIPIMNYLNQSPISSPQFALDKAGTSQEAKIAKLDDNAFGSLTKQKDAVFSTTLGRGATTESLVVNEEAASIAAPSEDAMVARGLGGGGGAMTSSKMIGVPAPEIINYEYEYKGEDLDSVEENLEVYKRVISDNSQGISSILKNNNFGLIDLQTFKNLNVTTLNISEDREFGYNIYLDMKRDNVSIHTNWEKWPQANQGCRDQACYDKNRLKESDVPADKKLIAMADKFLEQYNIKMTNFGPGQVMKQWQRTFGGPETIYIPENISVVYPLVINSKTVHEESGYVTGVTVDVNIRHNKVAGVHNLTSYNFQSSSYQAESNTTRLLEVAQNGGLMRNYQHSEANKTVTVELGTPSIELIRYWQMNQNEGKQGTELFIPALIFPIQNKDSLERYYQQAIVVPLVKEILDERMQDNPGMPEPMPLLPRVDTMEVKAVDEDE